MQQRRQRLLDTSLDMVHFKGTALTGSLVRTVVPQVKKKCQELIVSVNCILNAPESERTTHDHLDLPQFDILT